MTERNKIIKLLRDGALAQEITAKLGGDPEVVGYRLEMARTMREAADLLTALDVTPEELERLKMYRHVCKVDCLLEAFNKVVEERDMLRAKCENVRAFGDDGGQHESE